MGQLSVLSLPERYEEHQTVRIIVLNLYANCYYYRINLMESVHQLLALIFLLLNLCTWGVNKERNLIPAHLRIISFNSFVPIFALFLYNTHNCSFEPGLPRLRFRFHVILVKDWAIDRREEHFFLMRSPTNFYYEPCDALFSVEYYQKNE